MLYYKLKKFKEANPGLLDIYILYGCGNLLRNVNYNILYVMLMDIPDFIPLRTNICKLKIIVNF